MRPWRAMQDFRIRTKEDKLVFFNRDLLRLVSSRDQIKILRDPRSFKGTIINPLCWPYPSLIIHWPRGNFSRNVSLHEVKAIISIWAKPCHNRKTHQHLIKIWFSQHQNLTKRFCLYSSQAILAEDKSNLWTWTKRTLRSTIPLWFLVPSLPSSPFPQPT